MRPYILFFLFAVSSLPFITSCGEEENASPDKEAVLNSSPVVITKISNQPLNVGFGTAVISLEGIFSDDDNDPLVLSVSSSDTLVVTASILAQELTLTEIGIGASEITVKADDGNDGMISVKFIVSVTALTNNVPSVVNGIDNISLFEGFISENIDISDVFNDIDGDVLTLEASSSDDMVVTVSVSDQMLTITESGIGTAVISIVAEDGRGGRISEGFTVLNQEKENPITLLVETETATISDSWKMKTELGNYTGDGYIVWEGSPQFWKGESNIGKIGKLSYEIEITRAGTYKIELRSYIAKKDPAKPNTEHNDTWLKLPDADDFFAEKNGKKIYPKGSGKTPNPEGENGNGFFKIYMNINDQWTWSSGTSDNDFHPVFGTFNEPGTYTVELAPRSDFHALDAFRLVEQQ